METNQGTKQKILVVDDNSENIRIIGSILRQNLYQVGFATGGQQALDILDSKDEDYDLVLLDVNMPGMNGFEVCRKIRGNDKLKELPVIFLTANTGYEHIIEGFSSGGQDYVTKPFHAGELLARISTHLELKESREQLQQMNGILEEKVRERTRQLEEANQKLEAANLELEKLDEAKVEFLRLISHEINTPLNGIIGFADILTEMLMDTEYFSLVENLNHSANRLNDFAQSSLIITSMRTAPERYKKELVNLRQIITDVLKKQEVALDKKMIRTEFKCSAGNPVILGNEDLLKGCIMHLLKNAIYYSPSGKAIEIHCYSDDQNIIITLEDNGPGFSENAILNLYKPFSPGEGHIDKNKGLGLMLVKMIVDFHQAQINISNRTSSGGRVELVFKCCDA